MDGHNFPMARIRVVSSVVGFPMAGAGLLLLCADEVELSAELHETVGFHGPRITLDSRRSLRIVHPHLDALLLLRLLWLHALTITSRRLRFCCSSRSSISTFVLTCKYYSYIEFHLIQFYFYFSNFK